MVRILLTWEEEEGKAGCTHSLLLARISWRGDGKSCHTGFGCEGVVGKQKGKRHGYGAIFKPSATFTPYRICLQVILIFLDYFGVHPITSIPYITPGLL